MEFAKRLLAVKNEAAGEIAVSDKLELLPKTLLEDGTEVAVYGLLRTKRVQKQVTLRLLPANASEPDDEPVGETAEAVTP